MTDRTTRARTALVGALTAVVVLAGMLAGATPAAADHDVQPARVSGENRFATAANIAIRDHDGVSGVALLANGIGFADALAAAPLSRSTNAPLLLTLPDRLPAATDAALADLGVQHVILLGGSDAISTGLEAQLQQRFDQVDRFEGTTRFHTAVRIAESIDASPNASIGEIGGARTAMVVNAFAPADAVIAGSFAAGQANPFPVLFTEHDRLTPVTEQALHDRDIDQVLVIGGPLAVSDDVVRYLVAQGFDTTRLGGADRLETATRVADHARGTLGWDTSLVHLVRGDDYADALAAGPYAGRAGAPVLFTDTPTVLGQNTASWLASRCPGVRAIRAIGGQGAVTTAVLEEAITRAESCHDDGVEPQTQQTYMVAPMEVVEIDPGDRYEIRVIGRYDEQTFTGPVNVAIFPCQYSDVVGADPDTFQDADGDGNADFIGDSDAGSAAIVDVNGRHEGPAGQVHRVHPADDGILRAGLRAEASDCVVVAAYDDVDGDGQLDVDSDGQPTEPYGVTEISWG